MGSVFRAAKELYDLRQVVHLGQQQDHGRYLTGVCPFHSDEKPSLLVFRDGWQCMAAGCPRPHGSVLDWIAYERGLANPTSGDLYRIAKELVGDRDTRLLLEIDRDGEEAELEVPPPSVPLSGIVVRRYHSLLDSEAMAYLSGRGFCREFVDWNLWGWDGSAIVLPIWRGWPGDSEVIALRFRNLHSEPRYMGLKFHNEAALFNSWVVEVASRLSIPRVYCMFGEFDAALAVQAGIPAVSPTNGCRAFDRVWLGSYKGDVVFVPDVGEEDEAYSYAGELGLSGEVMQFPDWAVGHDPVRKDFTDIYMWPGTQLRAFLSLFDRFPESFEIPWLAEDQ